MPQAAPVSAPPAPLPVFGGRTWLPVSPCNRSPAPGPFAVAPPLSIIKRRTAAAAAEDDSTHLAANVVSAIDSLLHEDDSTLAVMRDDSKARTPRLMANDQDDDDDIPPPPPPDDDDYDDTASEASVRSSPDDNYDPKNVAAAAASTSEPSFPSQPPSKSFLPFCFAGGLAAGDDESCALEELEAASARNDDDEASYNGGTTEGDDDEADEEVDAEYGGFTITASGEHVALDTANDSGECPGQETSYEPFDELPRSHAASRAHPFLDMEAQRRQLEWERSQLRAAYHADMQRTVNLGCEEREKALQCLMNEAHRFHVRHAQRGKPHVPTPVWRDLAEAVAGDFTVMGNPTVQRNLSCMCIFSTVSAARQYGDHEEERARRQAGQHRTLQALRLQSARGGSPLFLRSPATPLRSPVL